MSYSFAVAASTKAEAASKASEQMAQVAASQSSHVADRQAAEDAAKAFVAVLREPAEGEQVEVRMSGSLSWENPDQTSFISASVNVSAFISKVSQ